jgi:hypothetical protein
LPLPEDCTAAKHRRTVTYGKSPLFVESVGPQKLLALGQAATPFLSLELISMPQETEAEPTATLILFTSVQDSFKSKNMH